MNKSENYVLTGPCGTYCGDCEGYKCKDDPALLEYLVSKGLNRDRLPCAGCRPLEGECPAVGGTCETYTCIVNHGVDYCFDCEEFPCAKLNPAAHKANVLPHNMKMYNLCTIKHQGIDKLVERIPEIKKRYYKGNMIVGKGPKIE